MLTPRQAGWLQPVPEDAHDAVAIVGLDGVIAYASPALCTLLGVDGADLHGRRFADLLQPDDGPVEQRYVRADGEVLWLLVDARVEHDASGAVRHVVCSVRDVTREHRAAELVRAGHERYRPVLEGTWVIDAEARTVSVGGATPELLGYAEEALRGVPIGELTDAEGRRMLDAAIARRRGGRREAYETKWRHRDGHEVWTLLSATPLVDDDGTYAGSFALVTDITERRRTEARLERHARQQEAVARVGRLALDGADSSCLLAAAARAACEVLRADAVTVALPGPDGELEVVAASGRPHPAGSADGAVRVALAARGAAGELCVRRDGAALEPDEHAFLETLANLLATALDRASADRELRRSALHDPLTGLANRALVLDRLDHAADRAAARGTPVVVVRLDLDRFKVVNDTLGGSVGDAVLRAVGDRLCAATRPADTVGRLGGDEFVVVCEDLPDEAAGAAIAAGLVEAFRTPLSVEGEEHALTVSAGVAIGGPGAHATDALLRDAATAMDRAKARGRDRYEVLDAQLRSDVAARLALERDLRGAVARGEISVAYQPIVALDGGTAIGVEALARWTHPERGSVAPDQFIAVAEDAGLIAGIGTAVLRAACAQVAVWREEDRPLTCHVNLSPHQVADRGLAACVAGVLEETGLPVEALVLEITESSLMEGGEDALARLQELRQVGVRLVLDDFGVGYSSLGRLRTCPIDGLKVDRSFVADLDGDGPQDALIVSGIVQLARALGLTVVAEGIETPEQLTLLRRMGCRYAQGYLLARPLDAAALGRVLAGPGLLAAS